MKYTLILLLVGISILASCADPVADDYRPQNVVEAFLIVGDSLKGIQIKRSQPTDVKYDSSKSWLRDAQVNITVNSQTIPLSFRVVNGVGEFYDPAGHIVQPKTRYSLSISLSDGTQMSAQTTTPDTLYWIKAPKPYMQFPKGNDSVTVPSQDSLALSWRSADPAISEFWISVQALDTVEYGKYLPVPTEEKNRRIGDPEAPHNQDLYQGEVTQWGYLFGNSVPVVWRVFRWYGKFELAIWATDKNMNDWLKLLQFQGSPKTYDPNQGSIKGGYGVFGSAAVIRGGCFIIKNQP